MYYALAEGWLVLMSMQWVQMRHVNADACKYM